MTLTIDGSNFVVMLMTLFWDLLAQRRMQSRSSNVSERFCKKKLKLELSEAKTLLTHAKTETARFLNYEIHTLQENTYRNHRDRRSLNGTIGLRVPREVVKNKCQSYKRYGRKIRERTELINDSDFTIMELYQSEYRGLVEYYRLAYNLHSLTEVEGAMEISLTKILASKYRISVPKAYKKYDAIFQEDKKRYKVLQVLITRWSPSLSSSDMNGKIPILD